VKGALSLRAQLLLLVGGPLFVLLLIEMIVSYRIGIHTANLVFDRWLLEHGHSLAQEVRHLQGNSGLIAQSAVIEVFEWDDLDSVYYRVDDSAGEFVAGTQLIQATAEVAKLRAAPVFADGHVEDVPTRLVSVLAMPGGGDQVVVTVAETLNKRKAMTSELLFEVLVTKCVLFMAVLLIIGVAFDRGLGPLVLLSRELAQRSPQDLAPIEFGRLPGEVRPIVENTNQLLARLDSAISSREQFIGNIAHQIRTPLAGMKLQAQLAERENDPAAIKEALQHISHTADHISHVNSQLMRLARAEAAFGRGVRAVNVDLGSIVRKCCKELAARAGEHRVQLVPQVPDEPVDVPGELTLLSEMVSNLIENAIVYGRPDGHVWIRLSRTAGAVTLAIEDDGPGIPREHWPRIFERFFRPAHSSGEGCGLGLSIVREIALAHGATVDLEERPEGSGVRFVVRFDPSRRGAAHA
jgi:two-component system sensor histidine kinase TctE